MVTGPIFSSMQTPEVPVAKRPKTSTEKSAKKRKREYEQQNGAQEPAEPSVKKVKKRKSEGAAESTAGAVPNGVQSSPAPQAGNANADVTERREPTVDDTDEERLGKKSKKGKTKARSDGLDPDGQAARTTEATSTKPEADVAKPNTLGIPSAMKEKQKKPKKGRHVSTNGDSLKVIASTSKSHRASQPHAEEVHESPETVSDEQLLQAHSPFVQRTETFYLALSPCANNSPIEGLVAEHISPLLLTYYPPLQGVVLKYSNARISETSNGNAGDDSHDVILSKAIDEYAVTFVYLTADFVLFSPTTGSYLEGYVNLQNESLLGLVCYNYFNAGLQRQRLPKGWRWVEDGSQGHAGAGKGGHGYWINGGGEKVDGRVVFRVKDFEAAPGGEGAAGSINVLGTLLSVKDDDRMDEEEKQRGPAGGRRK
ncbi:hypothetical protein LTR53_011638 [Teratosphaeriaceae sp. CCFEE 6253]|nr:hypothetical protein LTR53_011638 [Teratosphaeriaceae sp. CCFEE 6253]